jgi:hypothetical protein
VLHMQPFLFEQLPLEHPGRFREPSRSEIAAAGLVTRRVASAGLRAAQAECRGHPLRRPCASRNLVLVLGHLGFGSALVRPLASGLRMRWLLLGTLLPDVVDKTVYYALALATGRSGAGIGLISGTRTFGHTALLLAALLILGWWSRSSAILGIALGLATHTPLDVALDFLTQRTESSALLAFVFPLRGLRFAVMPYRSPLEHFSGLLDSAHLVTDTLGAFLLAGSLRRARRSPAEMP